MKKPAAGSWQPAGHTMAGGQRLVAVCGPLPGACFL
jgi:hypothetical protein